MNLDEMITIVAGISRDSAFTYSCFIIESLSQVLPNFSAKKIALKSCDWEGWMKSKCKAHGWSHSGSPLIWRETGIFGGDPTYVGGSLEFQKFINTYYGIDIVLSKAEQKALDYDYLLADNFKSVYDKEQLDILHFTISGAGRSVCPDLVMQLASMKGICKNGIEINLFDTPGHFFKIKDIVKDASAIGGELRSIQILENVSDGLGNCDILIILDHIARDEQESTESWLSRNSDAYKELSEQINVYANSNLKIIFCSTGPNCFCANVIVKEAPKINKNNVIVISAHYGLEMIYDFIKSMDVNLKGISCPPVWGFLGINQYVDVHHIIQNYLVYFPNKRALTSHTDSAQSLGIKYSELRWLFYLAFNKKPHEALTKRKSICMYHVGRTEDFQKCKAICDVLKLWYEKDDTRIGDEIITLGILSDGSFNIPQGIFFSQPVHLKILDDDSRVWVPCLEFPLPNDTSKILNNFIDTAELILKNTNLIK
ncbi:putative malate dehydrogenase 1B isoform X1 [Nasonia vitripennis]|uniref:Uncharacterized protein n=1 Tax=Nasonia vitripennis TaxID=7425 RepID=A0A7M7TDI9_NASVI|nr:putative malate dehydrogenase 1B [Nasonia vitripennis]XP_032455623.1 putative malate dehydrogenase 1B isoform X1 [Nasonia vitripennis]